MTTNESSNSNIQRMELQLWLQLLRENPEEQLDGTIEEIGEELQTVIAALEVEVRECERQERWEDALWIRQQLCFLQPIASQYLSLGNAYLELNRFDEARSNILRAVELHPDFAEAYFKLGNLEMGLENREKAIDAYEKAIAIEPSFAKPYVNLAILQVQLNQLEKAVNTLKRAIELQPELAVAYCNLSSVYLALGEIDQALASADRAVFLSPDYAKAYFNLGNALFAKAQFSQALDCLRKVIELKPDTTDAYFKLITFLCDRGNLEDAREIVDLYERHCRDIDPVRVLILAIDVYVRSGSISQEIVSRFLTLEKIINTTSHRLTPLEATAAFSTLRFCLPSLRDDIALNAHLTRTIGDAYIARAIAPVYGEQKLCVREKHQLEKYQREKHKIDRRLRIGVLSPNFRRHSVSWTSGDVLREISLISPYLYLYVTGKFQRDERTTMYEQIANKFYIPQKFDESGFSPVPEIVEQILTDDVDVLIDADSLTTYTHAAILHHQTAPIQLTWPGFDAPYCSQANYFVCDWHTHPAGAEQFCREQLIRMPHCYTAIAALPSAPLERAMLRTSLGISSDAVAFLCVASGSKIGPEMVRAQVRILNSVPKSLLFHKGNGVPQIIQTGYARECEVQGVDFDRIHFLSYQPTEELHRTNYIAADVLLDSYPFNGGTHSLEALWQELPLVTLVGSQFMSRLGYSYLRSLGIEEGIANTWEEYIAWGIRFGSDHMLRQHVKERLHRAKQLESLSPLWNPRQFAADMYSIFEDLLSSQTS